jgi:hypothetical protein
MEKWEYKTIDVSFQHKDVRDSEGKRKIEVVHVLDRDSGEWHEEHYHHREDLMNEFGAQGWEMFAVEANTWYFKRRLQE